jgi:DnaK suppressor protein
MDSVDMASHHRDQDLVNMLCYRSQKLVSEIRSAIKRIDDGKFGTCWLCSSSIALERLRAHPTAILCVRCQGAIETLKRRYPVA